MIDALRSLGKETYYHRYYPRLLLTTRESVPFIAFQPQGKLHK
jgi:hypothetical protein